MILSNNKNSTKEHLVLLEIVKNLVYVVNYAIILCEAMGLHAINFMRLNDTGLSGIETNEE